MLKNGLPVVFLLIANLVFSQVKTNILPQPVSQVITEGSFTLNAKTSLVYKKSDKDLQAAAKFLASQLERVSGYTLPVNKRASSTIELKKINDSNLGSEGYVLTVTQTGIKIEAPAKAGILYGIQSLLQLLPAIRTNADLAIPCMVVRDYPRFPYRGMHLDVARHFFGPEAIKDYIDLIASYKMNVFHWHLVDDQGWRIEIKQYPKLTEVGAWRGNPNQPYGGYYTQDQVREIVNYAWERGVTIVPEIEMPGHAMAALEAYPELGCTGGPYQIPETWGVFKDVFCAGNEQVFTVLEGVMDEVLKLFPSSYIHIGGDECPKDNWKACPKCQQRIKEEKLKDEHELQSYFITRMEKYLNSKGRTIIGWDEILEGGLAPNAVVMSWRGEQGGIDAAKMDHDVVMTPGNPLYFDKYQKGPDFEPIAFGGMNTLKMVYDYEPVPDDLPNDKKQYVLGAQANLWTEYITTASHLQYMVLPRMLALSEVVWSPTASKSWINFYGRLQAHFERLGQQGYHFAQVSGKVYIIPIKREGQLLVELKTEKPDAAIHYTLDGSIPSVSSPVYSEPFILTQTAQINAITVHNGVPALAENSFMNFVVHEAFGKAVNYVKGPSSSYMAGGLNALTDGIRGSIELGRHWHGFEGRDVTATIDLGKVSEINKISLGSLQSYNDWVFLPKEVRFEVSENGIDFKEVGRVKTEVSVEEKNKTIFNFSLKLTDLTTRFIRCTAKALEGCPPGHPGAGLPAWMFLDELIVE